MTLLLESAPTLGEPVTACFKMSWPEAAEAKPVRVLTCLDVSGSMHGDKLDTAKIAAKTMGEALPKGSQFGLAAFSDRAETVLKPTEPIDAGKIDALAPQSSTNLEAGLRQTLRDHLEAPTELPTTLIVLTDGAINGGAVNTGADVLALLKEFGVEDQISLRLMGIGADYNEHFLISVTEAVPGAVFRHCDVADVAGSVGELVGLCLDTAATKMTLAVWGDDGVEVLTAHDEAEIPGYVGVGQMLFRQPVASGGTDTYFTFNLQVGALDAGAVKVHLKYKDRDGKQVVRRIQFTAPWDRFVDDALQVTEQVVRISAARAIKQSEQLAGAARKESLEAAAAMIRRSAVCAKPKIAAISANIDRMAAAADHRDFEKISKGFCSNLRTQSGAMYCSAREGETRQLFASKTGPRAASTPAGSGSFSQFFGMQ